MKPYNMCADMDEYLGLLDNSANEVHKRIVADIPDLASDTGGALTLLWARLKALKVPSDTLRDLRKNVKVMTARQTNATRPVQANLTTFATHESGNVDAWLAAYPERFAWNDALGWLAWSGTHWLQGGAGEAMVRRSMEQTLLQRTADLVGTNKLADVMPTAARVRGMLALAAPRLYTEASVFTDASNKHLLNTASGVVNLRDDVPQRPAVPTDYFMWCVPTPYDPEETEEDLVWRAMVLDWNEDRAEMAEYVQRSAGYSITGESSEKCVFFVEGVKGNNGKTTMIRAIKDCLNSRIIHGIGLDVFTEASRKADPQGFGLIPLIYARFVPASEGDMNDALKGSVIKVLTSHGDPLQVAEKGKQAIEWQPTVKIWAMSNHPPKINSGDPRALERFRVIPFNRIYEGDKCDKGLQDRLAMLPQRQVTLRWLVQGARAWYAQGVGMPQVVAAANHKMEMANNTAALFVESCLKRSDKALLTSEELHRFYINWCHQEGVSEDDRKLSPQLGKALSAAGYIKHNNRKWYATIATNDEACELTADIEADLTAWLN